MNLKSSPTILERSVPLVVLPKPGLPNAGAVSLHAKQQWPDGVEKIAKRLLLKTRYNPANGCLEWVASKNNKGYGMSSVRGRFFSAHRLSYILWVGPIPIGLNVLHTCDNPCCILPKHLFSGTQKENQIDCLTKGRARRARGSAAPTAVLDEIKVATLRQLFVSGDCTNKAELGRRFGVDGRTVCAIIFRRTWKHV